MSEALRVRDISVYYPMRRGVFSRVSNYLKAVQNISLDLDEAGLFDAYRIYEDGNPVGDMVFRGNWGIINS